MQPQTQPPKHKATPGETIALAALIIVGMFVTLIAMFNSGPWAGLPLALGFTWIAKQIVTGNSGNLRKPFSWSKRTAAKGSYHALGVGFVWLVGGSVFLKLLTGPTPAAPPQQSNTSRASFVDESIASNDSKPTPTEKGDAPRATETPEPTPTEQPTRTPRPSATPAPTATPKPSGTIIAGGNFRSEPVVDATTGLGLISIGDEVEFIELREGWYKVRVTKATGLDSVPVGTVGWINATLVSEPSGPVRVSTAPLPTARPEPTAVPLPTEPPYVNHYGVAPVTAYDCPADYPVKGNQSGIYHTPYSRYYSRTKPEICYASAADAEAAGYRAPRQ